MKTAFTEDVLISLLKGSDSRVAKIFKAVARSKIEGYVSFDVMAGVYDKAVHIRGGDEARAIVSELAFILKILALPSDEDYLLCYNTKRDIRDSVLAASMMAADVPVVITYDVSRFDGLGVRAMTPVQAMSELVAERYTPLQRVPSALII